MKSAVLLFTVFMMVTALAHAELPSAKETTVKQALSSGKPAVIDLGARTCIPCKKMAPILEAVAGECRNKATVLFIDVHEDQAAAQKFGVQMIPTQIFFDAKGKEVTRHMGFMEKADILKSLKKAGMQ